MQGPVMHVEMAQIEVRSCNGQPGSGFSIWTDRCGYPIFKVPLGSQSQPLGGYLVFRVSAGARLFRGKLLTRYDLVSVLSTDDQSELKEIPLASNLIEPEGFSLPSK